MNGDWIDNMDRDME